MGIYVKRRNLKGIDRQNSVVKFDENARHGKITGSRFLSVLGKDEYTTEFKAACMLARVCFDDTKTKYTIAGEIIEPIMRSYARDNRDRILREMLGIGADDAISVEEPVAAKDCWYDHFRKEKIFGGMVDGYIVVHSFIFRSINIINKIIWIPRILKHILLYPISLLIYTITISVGNGSTII